MTLLQLGDQVRMIVTGRGARDDRLMAICRLLQQEVAHYHWVGFYLADEAREMLFLGPYAGQPTRHARIPFGQGICGLAAQKRQPLMVPDVSRVVNYLSCGLQVKSEFVVPVFREGRLVAELDIDSHELNAFSAEDKSFLEDVAEMVAGLF
jgi:GAF domain-containing protein